MKKEYIKPSLKDHKLQTARLLESTVPTDTDDTTGQVLSKGNGGAMLDWGDGWNDDSDQ